MRILSLVGNPHGMKIDVVGGGPDHPAGYPGVTHGSKEHFLHLAWPPHGRQYMYCAVHTSGYVRFQHACMHGAPCHDGCVGIRHGIRHGFVKRVPWPMVVLPPTPRDVHALVQQLLPGVHVRASMPDACARRWQGRGLGAPSTQSASCMDQAHQHVHGSVGPAGLPDDAAGDHPSLGAQGAHACMHEAGGTEGQHSRYDV